MQGGRKGVAIRSVQARAFEPSRARRLRLTRFFSTASFVGILIVIACLFFAYREFTVRQLIDHESRANAHLTRAFANVVWDKYRGFMLGSRGRSREELLADPALARLRADVLTYMRSLKVAKIKIYNVDGLTVFSTDPRQIGEDKSANRGFRGAKAGRVMSEITYRDTFDSFEGVLSKRNLIFSYIPARGWPEDAAAGVFAKPEGVFAEPEGVFEVYSDVTDLLEQKTRAEWQLAGIVLTVLATLYLFLFFVVRLADRIMRRQERERVEEEHIRRANSKGANVRDEAQCPPGVPALKAPASWCPR
jgi:hypothetical protein